MRGEEGSGQGGGGGGEANLLPMDGERQTCCPWMSIQETGRGGERSRRGEGVAGGRGGGGIEREWWWGGGDLSKRLRQNAHRRVHNVPGDRPARGRPPSPKGGDGAARKGPRPRRGVVVVKRVDHWAGVDEAAVGQAASHLLLGGWG